MTSRSLRIHSLMMSFLLAGSAHLLAGDPAAPRWEDELARQLPLMGHRNWIVIADAAYPWQNASGVRTLVTDMDHLEVLRVVLARLERFRHVRPVVHVDAELAHVPESHAAGIGVYRAGLEKMLKGCAVRRSPHEEIISRLDETGKVFQVLVLKTKLTLPYTSVFLELDCGYWSAEAERELRARMTQSQP